ncbi:MAG: VCBS repeat-containing protein [Acidobacteriaceae bacterium]|nr:VCBS repeat-containing protein [Acidobacteriaceae bacterium]MBV9940230.1 VCBS repeat-containing protein [Acidobacteriaceae bacterium]
MNGGQITSTLTFAHVCRVSEGCWPRWQVIAIGDFNSDGIDDLFWYDTQTGRVNVGMQDGRGKQKAAQWLAKVCGPSDGCSQNWKPAGMADVNQDGTGDLLWENVTTGEISAWLLNGTDRIQGTPSLSLRCDSAAGCPPGSLPVGILRNRLATP